MDDIAVFVLGMFAVMFVIALNILWTLKINKKEIKKRMDELKDSDHSEY